jgi:hypothetical protein
VLIQRRDQVAGLQTTLLLAVDDDQAGALHDLDVDLGLGQEVRARDIQVLAR